ncbi:cytochrome C assembly family protein [Amantichitinum ursilacus]|uniref:Inner membrane protein YpjD n=1 Tax=Amantichitinum ursilacus TaxID=857265 RepID=A0A0N0GKP1_9NEIS|nr:cytochrome c biogenesis protein CcsA [Amantichitinum ursilacus]KPC49223.1 Inner membrane protein YpjD [Amantichitinum ursilacus]
MSWLALIALFLYLALGWHFCRTRLAGRGTVHAGIEHGLLLLALALHGFALWPALAVPPLHFGAGEALSVTAWLALLIYLVGHLAFQLEGMEPPVLALAVILLGASILLPPGHALTYPQNGVSRLHFLTAMLAYGLFANASGVALLMRLADKRLHHATASLLVQKLPPLLALERLLFACVWVGFLLLTVALITGATFSEEIFGKALEFNHKIVFSIAAWLVFGGLLIGRKVRGWRGLVATRWTLFGFILLLFGYIGTRLVLDVILHRAGA